MQTDKFHNQPLTVAYRIQRNLGQGGTGWNPDVTAISDKPQDKRVTDVEVLIGGLEMNGHHYFAS